MKTRGMTAYDPKKDNWDKFSITNKDLFENSPYYMDNLSLWKYNIYLGQILYPVKTYTIYNVEKYNLEYKQIQYPVMTNVISI